jgi:hypothetical protein
MEIFLDKHPKVGLLDHMVVTLGSFFFFFNVSFLLAYIIRGDSLCRF